MITVLTGENSFELARALDATMSAFAGEAEKFDGENLELAQLPDLLLGGTLFSSERLIVIKNLSDNKQLWGVLPEWLEKVGADTHVVFVEPKPDKRTRTYKELKKHATLREFAPWGDRDTMLAEKWVTEEASRQKVALDKKLVRQLVERVGLDQWQLFHAIEKLAVVGEVTEVSLERYIEANPTENVFNLLDAALRGDSRKVSSMVSTLRVNQDPYMTFGLLSGQVFQLAALTASDKPSAEVAKDIGAHPYALSKLAPHASSLGRRGAKKLVAIFADTDTLLKSNPTDPWILIEQALAKTAIS